MSDDRPAADQCSRLRANDRELRHHPQEKQQIIEAEIEDYFQASCPPQEHAVALKLVPEWSRRWTSTNPASTVYHEAWHRAEPDVVRL